MKIVILLLPVGFFFRVVLAGFSPQQLYFDAAGYLHLAREIRASGWAAECCNHNAGYGLFLAAIFTILGSEALGAVYLIQIAMDVLVAVSIYCVGARQFSRSAGMIGYVMYLFNPFTASYTGMLLSEILALNFIVGIALFLSGRYSPKRLWFWAGAGALFGLLVFVKLSFYYYSFLFLVSLWMLLRKQGAAIAGLPVAFIGFFVTSLYSLLSYHSLFRVWTVTPPYSWGPTYMYTTLLSDRRYPELVSDFHTMHPELAAVSREYYATPHAQKAAFTKTYRVRFFREIKTRWPQFLAHVGQNMLWMWDKTHLFSYEDPFHPRDTILLRILNIGGIGLFLYGVTSYLRIHGWTALRNPLVWFSLTATAYMTVFFSLVTNETRHTIPYYPLLLLWAGYGAQRCFGAVFPVCCRILRLHETEIRRIKH